MSRIYAILSITLIGYLGFNALAQTQNSTNNECLPNIKVWADNFGQKGETRTLHFYRPIQNENSDIIVLYMYTPMQVYCPSNCEKMEADDAAYSFYRSTHYWSLKRVFNDILLCKDRKVDTKRNLFGKRKTQSQKIETHHSNIHLVWSADECALEGANTVKWGGCISIKTSPK